MQDLEQGNGDISSLVLREVESSPRDFRLPHFSLSCSGGVEVELELCLQVPGQGGTGTNVLQ